MNDTPHFNGPEYRTGADHKRLSKQHERIRDLMQDGNWRTIEEISDITGYPQASVSAQLRHLRKPRFGSFIIDTISLLMQILYFKNCREL